MNCAVSRVRHWVQRADLQQLLMNHRAAAAFIRRSLSVAPCVFSLSNRILLYFVAQLRSLPRHATDASAEPCVIWISDTLILCSCSIYSRYRSGVCHAVSAGLELLVHKQTHDRPDAARHMD